MNANAVSTVSKDSIVVSEKTSEEVKKILGITTLYTRQSLS